MYTMVRQPLAHCERQCALRRSASGSPSLGPGLASPKSSTLEVRPSNEDHDVLGLDVAMHHSGGVRSAEACPRYCTAESGCSRIWKTESCWLARRSRNVTPSTYSIERNSWPCCSGAKRIGIMVQVVRMVQGGCSARFEARPGAIRDRGSDLRRKEFDRDPAVEAKVACQPHLAHAAAADGGDELVSVNGGWGFCRHRTLYCATEWNGQSIVNRSTCIGRSPSCQRTR